MAHPIETTKIPEHSKIHTALASPDYSEAYRVVLPNGIQTDVSSATRAILFEQSPRWIDSLMELRNKFAKWSGLKIAIIDRNEVLENFSFDRETLGLFHVYGYDNREVILGEDDKHLDFRVSIHVSDSAPQEVTVSTVIDFKNWFGRLYFIPVSFFHRLMVKFLLRNAKWTIA